MVSLGVLVAAGEQDAAQRALAAPAFERSVLLSQGLPLPPVTVQGDAALRAGHVVACINGERGGVEEGPVVDSLWRAIRSRGAALLDDEATRTLLDLLHDSHPVTVDAARARFDLPFLRRRLQALLAEGIAINDLRGILESLLILRGYQIAPPAADERALVLSEAAYDREVRAGLRHVITLPHVRQGQLEVHVVEEVWRTALSSPPSPVDLSRLRRAVAAAIGDRADAVLLTDAESRVILRELLRHEWPGLTVLAFNDLPPDLNICVLDPVA